jgi:hypothetical protein
MTQKKLNSLLERLLDDGIVWYEVEVTDYRIVQTVVRVKDLEFEISTRQINKQTLVEGEDFSTLLDEVATLQDDAWLLCSELNFIYERRTKC